MSLEDFMKMFGFLKKGIRASAPLAVLVCLQACGKDGSKRADPTPNNPQLLAEIHCSDTLKNGESQSVQLYRSQFAPFGQTCESTKFDGQEICTQGVISSAENASQTCEETDLKSMRIVANTQDLELGQNLGLTLEGVDQRGGKFTFANTLAKWTTNNDFAIVSTSGVVSGKLALNDVVVTAKVGKITAQYKLNIVGKRCGETPDNGKRKISLFESPKVAFGESCKAVELDATCKNGAFVFAKEMSESCEVAKLSRLEATPTALFLNPGQSAKVELFLVDDIGTKIPVSARDAQWNVPSSGEVTVADGRVTLRRTIEKASEITIEANGLTSSIWVSARADAPTLLDFEEKAIVLKVGDEKLLKVRATETVDPIHINWESSDPAIVSISNGTVKALKPDGEAIIIARLNGKMIQTKVRVEAELKLTHTAVTYATTQQGKVHPVTQDKVSLLPAYIIEMNVTSTDGKPLLETVTEGCKFNLRFNRQKWELDVQLEESNEVLPANCEANVTVETQAGQKLTQNFKIPVDYNKVSLVESLPIQVAEGIEIGRIQYKMSASYSVDSATVKTLVEGESKCEWALLPEASSYRVVLTNKSVNGCAGQIVLKMSDANDGLVLTVNELIVGSKTRSFEDYCKNPGSSKSKTTVDAIRKEFGPSLGCDKLASLMRSRSLGSLASNRAFPLALDNRDLSDLSPLARFVGLRELSLAANPLLSDIGPLSALKQLRSLNLKFTAVKDLAPIKNHQLMNDLRLPAQLKVECSNEIINPEIKKLCE
jgi:hypothetical protein